MPPRERPKSPVANQDAPKLPVKEAPKAQTENEWKGPTAVMYVMKRRLEISDVGFDGVKNYEYKGGAYTPVDNYLNDNLWTPLAKFLPAWVAPNLVTLFGLMWIVLSFCVLCAYAPGFKGAAPFFVYLFTGLCVFFYQTLDAMDGKQARATGSSSPLGQLFDHGCDSVTSTFLALGVCTTLNLGVSLETMALLFSVQLPFFLAQWQEYHTHQLAHAVGRLGVTEAQLLTMSIHLLGALFGSRLYLLQIGPVRVNQIVLFTQLGLGLFVTVNTCKTVFSNSKVNKTDAVLQLLPLLGVILCGCVWAATADTSDNLYKRHPLMLAMLLGILFTHLSNQIIVCSLCRMPYPRQWILLPLPLLFALDYSGMYRESGDVIFGVYAGAVLLRIAQYITNFIEEITHFLGIYCLTLGPRKPPSSKDR